VRRREGERPDGAPESDAQERRRRRDRHPAVPQAEPGLAEDREDEPRAEQDPRGAAGGAAGTVARPGPPAPREGAAEAFPEPQQGDEGAGVRRGAAGVPLQDPGGLHADGRVRKASLMPLLRRLLPPDQLQEKTKESRLSTLIRKVVTRRPSTVIVKGMDSNLRPPGELLPPGAGRSDRRVHHPGAGGHDPFEGLPESPRERSCARGRGELGGGDEGGPTPSSCAWSAPTSLGFSPISPGASRRARWTSGGRR